MPSGEDVVQKAKHRQASLLGSDHLVRAALSSTTRPDQQGLNHIPGNVHSFPSPISSFIKPQVLRDPLYLIVYGTGPSPTHLSMYHSLRIKHHVHLSGCIACSWIWSSLQPWPPGYKDSEKACPAWSKQGIIGLGAIENPSIPSLSTIHSSPPTYS